MADIRKNNSFIQSKTFTSKEQSEQYAVELETNIDSILNLKPKKHKKFTPDKVKTLGVALSFQKLEIELEFKTFETLADEYMQHWKGKDKNQIYRALYWQNTFL